jgi:hypothetical protein
MARVEKDLKLQQEIQGLREEVVKTEKQVKKNSRGGKWFLSCGAIFLFLFLILVGVAVWFLAITGLVTVPIISQLVYKEPQPIHRVEAGVPLDVLITETFNSLITERLQAGGGNLSDRSIQVSLPESAITTSLRSLAEENDIAWFDSQKIQVAIESEKGVEIFVPLVNWDNNNAVRMLLTPSVENGIISLSNLSVSLGNFTFPSWLTNLLVKPMAEKGLESLNQKISSYISLENIELFDGKLDVSGSLVVEIMKF